MYSGVRRAGEGFIYPLRPITVDPGDRVPPITTRAIYCEIMPLLIILAVGLWFVFGDPGKTTANWFWEKSAAPWESVDAFYYPDRTDLTIHQSRVNLDDVDACRIWVRSAAAAQGDVLLMRGDYECGVGKIENVYDLSVYRITVR